MYLEIGTVKLFISSEFAFVIYIIIIASPWLAEFLTRPEATHAGVAFWFL